MILHGEFLLLLTRLNLNFIFRPPPLEGVEGVFERAPSVAGGLKLLDDDDDDCRWFGIIWENSCGAEKEVLDLGVFSPGCC